MSTIIPVLLVTVPHKTFLHFSTKGDKAASEGSDGKKDGVTRYPYFSLPLSVVSTHAYLAYLIRYQTFIKNFPPTVSIRF